MIRRAIALLTTIALGLLVAPLAPEAQPPKHVHRIGFLVSGVSYVEVFRQGLRDLGYVEGQTIALESRDTEGSYERLLPLVGELVRLPVDVLVVGGTTAVRTAQQATQTIPIVMAFSGDPVGTGLVASLARPGGNVTGLSLMALELSGKRLALLQEAVPGVTRVAVLRHPDNPATGLTLRETEVAARGLGMQMHSLEVRTLPEVARAFHTMTREGAEALIVLPSGFFTVHRTAIVEVAAKSRLPAIYQEREYVEVGGLMAYGPNFADLYRRAASYVDKILKGAKPADLPVEQPTTFELVINLKTAEALGLTIPPSLLLQATEVIR
jgi:putative tryptophan/tyrosine transport system substrate-binding protein